MRPTSPSRDATSGSTGLPASGSGCGPVVRATTAASTTATTVTATRAARPLCCMASPLRDRAARLALAAAEAYPADDDGDDGNEDRHQRDIEEFGHCLQPVDILA